MRRAPITLTLVVSLITLGACAQNTLDRRPTYMRAPNVLARQDFIGDMDSHSMFDVLQSLRPTFLYSRGSNVSVALDGVFLGSSDVLRDIPAGQVQQVELLNGPDATLRYGSHHGGPVLLVTTRRQ